MTHNNLHTGLGVQQTKEALNVGVKMGEVGYLVFYTEPPTNAMPR